MQGSDRKNQKKKFLQDAQTLANIYWFIRASRGSSAVRRHYRKAQKEKGRLAALGHDPEAVRLYRLWLRSPRREDRLKRFNDHFEKPIQLTLF